MLVLFVVVAAAAVLIHVFTDVIGYLTDVEYSGPIVAASCNGFTQDTTLYSCTGSYSCLSPKHATVKCNSSG